MEGANMESGQEASCRLPGVQVGRGREQRTAGAKVGRGLTKEYERRM